MGKLGKFYVELGKTIQASRIEKNISQEELGNRLNLSRTAIANWEQGTRRIDIDNYLKLCTILEIDPNETIKDIKKYL